MAQASMVGVYHQLATRFLVLLVETTEHRQEGVTGTALGPRITCWLIEAAGQQPP